MRKLLCGLIILVRIEEAQLGPQSQHPSQSRDRQLNRLDNGRLFTLPFERDLAAAERIMLNHDMRDHELGLRKFVTITCRICRLLIFLAALLGSGISLRSIVSLGGIL